MTVSKNTNNKPPSNRKRAKRTMNLPQKSKITKDLHTINELNTFDAAATLAKLCLDPESSVKHLALQTAEPATVFRPKKVFDISAPPLDKQPFICITAPSLRDPIWITDYAKEGDSFYLGRREFSYDFDAQDALAMEPSGRDEEGTEIRSRNFPPGGYQMSLRSNVGKSMLICHWDQTKLGGSGAWVWNVDKDTTTNTIVITILFDIDGANAGAGAVIHYSYSDGSSGAVAMTLTSNERAIQLIGTIPTAAKSVNQIWIQYVPATSALLLRNLRMNINFNDNLPAQFNLLHAQVSTDDVSAQVERSCERYINVGTAVWLEYNGSTLENGGTITGIQVLKNFNFSDPLSAWYDRIAKMPGAYSGALKNGLYQLYVPTDRRDLVPRPIHNRGITSHLVLAGVLDNKDSTLKVTLTQCVVGTTLSNVFVGKHFPQNTHAIDLALTYLSHLRNTMCNPRHLDNIRKAIAWLNAHREQIKKGAITAAQAAKMLAPLFASLV